MQHVLLFFLWPTMAGTVSSKHIHLFYRWLHNSKNEWEFIQEYKYDIMYAHRFLKIKLVALEPSGQWIKWWWRPNMSNELMTTTYQNPEYSLQWCSCIAVNYQNKHVHIEKRRHNIITIYAILIWRNPFKQTSSHFLKGFRELCNSNYWHPINMMTFSR